MNEQTTPTAPTIEEMLALLDEWSPGETRPGKPEIWDAIRSTLLSHAEVVKERDGLREECRSWRGLADDALCRAEKAEAALKALTPEPGNEDEDDAVVLGGIEMAARANTANPEIFDESFAYVRSRMRAATKAEAEIAAEKRARVEAVNDLSLRWDELRASERREKEKDAIIERQGKRLAEQAPLVEAAMNAPYGAILAAAHALRAAQEAKGKEPR